MSTTQRRPYLVFSFLAVAVAVVLAQGLRVEAAQVLVRAGVPLPIAGVLTPDLMLGQSLVGRPVAAAEQGTSALDERLRAASLQHERQQSAVAAPRSGQVLRPVDRPGPPEKDVDAPQAQPKPSSGTVRPSKASHGKAKGAGKPAWSGQRSTWSGHKGGDTSKGHAKKAQKAHPGKGKATGHGKSRRR